MWRRISTFPTASPRFCLHQRITSFSISNFLCKTPTSSYSSVLFVRGCPLSRIRKYEFPFPLSRKASNPLTMAEKWIKNKAVTFPHENSLNLHIYLAPGHVSLICPFGLRCISLLCPENYISQTSLLAAFWFSQWETMLGDWWADERERSGYFFPLPPLCFDWHLLCGPRSCQAVYCRFRSYWVVLTPVLWLWSHYVLHLFPMP